MPVEAIAERLDQPFQLLTGGSRSAPSRQHTLKAAMDWSWNLLVTPEQILLARLSVFAGGWVLAAAEAVCTEQRNRAGRYSGSAGRAGEQVIGGT